METYWVLCNGGIECRVATPSLADATDRSGVPLAAAHPGAQGALQPFPNPSQAGFSGLKLTARGRGILAAAVLAVSLPFASAGAVAAASAPPPAVSVQPYTVAAGESLWTIAERYKAPGVDTRDQVTRIKKLNHLHSSDIYAGQVILVDFPS